MVQSLAVAIAVAFVLAFALTPPVRRLSFRMGLVDLPGARRMHDVPMPRGGGLAIFLAFWAAMGLVPGIAMDLWGLFAASLLIVCVGLLDDRFQLRWYLKLGGQALAALVFVIWGGRIEFVTHPLTGHIVYLAGWGVPLTVLWLVALTNMVNLIDGLDGLAAGVCVIACVPLFVVALALGRIDAALLSAALGAAALGFLPHNVHPARIIMGDTGAMFLGFTLAAVSVEGALKGPATLAFVVPVLAFGLPIFETLFSIARRAAAGRPIYEADRDHLHHRLLALGLNHRQAVWRLYGLSALMGLGAIVAVEVGKLLTLAVLGGVTLGTLLFARSVGGLKGPQETVHATIVRKERAL